MDRFFRGLIGGMIGGVCMDIFNFISFYLINFANLSIIDWSSIILYGYKSFTTAQFITALIAQIFWAGFLGIILVYLLLITTSQGYLIKGAFLGFMFSFITYAIPVMFDIHHINNVTLGTALTDLIGGMIWGLVTVKIFYLLGTSFNFTP